MTDRELLELAAKAAGFTDAEWAAEQASICTVQAGKGFQPFWNPLRDDGDALRLAVKLEMLVDAMDGRVIVGTNSPEVVIDFKIDGDDPYAATRRAIVRAAAEIGKGMK